MSNQPSRRWRAAAAIAALLTCSSISSAFAMPQIAASAGAPSSAASGMIDDDFGADVRVFNEHIVTLANPFMEGRAPGTRGMEIAKEYFEHYLRRAGIEPGFENGTSYRQPFAFGGSREITRQSIVANIGTNELSFAPGVDQVAVSTGVSGGVTGPMIYVGYSIDNGPNGYSNFGRNTDLSGKVALMYRFGPMDENGVRLWNGSAAEGATNINNKIRSASERGAVGIIILNPPGSADPRASQLLNSDLGIVQTTLPIMMMSADAGSRLLEAASDRTAMALRRFADAGGGTVPLDGSVTIDAHIDQHQLMAENVGGLLPGRGRLADEYIVIGAHLDHLGMVRSGARSGVGDVYHGADDNASGSSAVLMLASKLAAEYAGLPADADARSILFIGFSGEESGLKGSQHYVNNPIAPMQSHDMMINLDMIGRIENSRLNITGSNSAQGFEAWLDPFYERSDLDVIKTNKYERGASDHASFGSKGVPFLFAIMAGDLHDDYHTPGDVSWKINREDSVRTVYLVRDIALAAAQRSERLVFGSGAETVVARSNPQVVPPSPQPPQGQAPGGARVRVGIQPSDYDSTNGVPIGAVTGNGPADKAGMRAGDVIITWNGKAVKTIDDYMDFTAQSEPGEVVIIGVRRGESVVVLKVTLEDAGGL